MKISDNIDDLTLSGESITKLVREWFWNDEIQFSIVERLLLACMEETELSVAEKRELAHEIVEGRKKLCGSGYYSVEDDNENVLDLSKKSAQRRIANELNKIREDMSENFIKYVDIYSTVKSHSKAAGEAEHVHYGQPVVNYEDCKAYFWHDEEDFDPKTGEILKNAKPTPAAEKATMGGLWLIKHPELVYRATRGDLKKLGDADTFWAKIHDLIKDDPKFSDPAFRERNKGYESDLEYRAEKKARQELISKRLNSEEHRPTFRMTKARRANLDKAGKLLERASRGTREQFSLEEAVDSLIDLTKEDNLLYHLVPDEMDKWEGLINPFGEFFSCEIGQHGKRAYQLIQMMPDILVGHDVEKELREKKITEETALKDLLLQGWCSTEFLPSLGYYVSVPADAGSNRKLKKAQVDRIWEAALKHNVVLDTTKIDEG